jgi:hypothetical protein
MKITSKKLTFLSNKVIFTVVSLLILCSSGAFAQLTVNAGSPVSICLGSNVIIGGSPTASGTFGYSYSWAPTAGLNNPTVSNPTASPTTTTTYTVTVLDSLAGTQTSTIVVTVLPIPSVAANSASICGGEIANLYASGADTYVWNPSGLTTSSIDVSPASTTSYTVTGTSAGCTGTAIATVTVMPSSSINGYAGYSGGAVSGSSVILYHYSSSPTMLDTVQAATTDGSGMFNFNFIPTGDYLIELFPSASYTTLSPSYYSHSFLWDSAMVLSHGCGVSDTIGFSAIEVAALSGPGSISGKVTAGDGFSRAPGDPIPGVDVKLGRNPGGQLVAVTETNSSGDYSFSGVPVNVTGEHYTIYVDIPGLERDSTYSVTITSGTSNFTQLNYTADSNSVTAAHGIGIKKISVDENKLVLSPNPAKENVLVEYTIKNSSQTSLGIYNILGVKVADLENKTQAAGSYKYNLNLKNYNLNAGIYFITLETDGKKTTQRLVISE